VRLRLPFIHPRFLQFVAAFRAFVSGRFCWGLHAGKVHPSQLNEHLEPNMNTTRKLIAATLVAIASFNASALQIVKADPITVVAKRVQIVKAEPITVVAKAPAHIALARAEARAESKAKKNV
jgi:hypothetical protein